MIEADKPAFVAALAELSLLRPALKLTEAHYAAWWNAMAPDWTIEQFQSAARKLAQECDDVLIGPHHFAALRRAAEPTAAEAWRLVSEKARAWNRYDRIRLGARIDEIVEQMGGYYALSMQESDQSSWNARRFASLWSDAATAESARALTQDGRSPLRLVGGTDSEAAR